MHGSGSRRKCVVKVFFSSFLHLRLTFSLVLCFSACPSPLYRQVFQHVSKFVTNYRQAVARSDESKRERKETYAERKAREAKEGGETAADAKPADGTNGGAEPKRNNPFAKSVRSNKSADSADGNGSAPGSATATPSKTNPFAKAKAPAAADGAAEEVSGRVGKAGTEWGKL